MFLLVELIRNELKYSRKYWGFDCMQFLTDVFATSLSAAPFIFLGTLSGLENVKLLALVVLSIKIFMGPFISSLFHFLWAFREGHLLVFMTRPFSNILFYLIRWLSFRLVFLSTITSFSVALLTAFIVPIPLHRVLIAILSVSLWAFFFSSIFVYLSCLFEKDMPLDYLFSLL